MKSKLDILYKEFKAAERHYKGLCKAYNEAFDNTEGELFEILQAMKVYDDIHLLYSVEYSKEVNS